MSLELKSSDDTPIEIVVCYGTSCFARGNGESLDLLNKLAQRPDSKITLRMTGRLCQEQCADGPNLIIGGKLYHSVTHARLGELLQELGATPEVENGTA